MLTRSLTIAIALLGCGVFPLSGAQAKSSNSHSGTHATNHQASSGTSTAAKKNGQVTKKKVKPTISDITVTKTKDQSSPQ
ncbi:MAG TPA: hypothetical protein VHD59_03370 [Pseudolabrys sp.]|jgi:hypothetical protein|nr:hypothetical protein [Pseudolabrys sp.]